MKFLHALLTTILVFFFISMVLMRLTYGSFEMAGEKMDRFMGAAGTEVGAAADDVAEATDTVVKDIADGPDDEN